MAHTLKCTTDWCSFRKWSYCSLDDKECKDREDKSDEYSARLNSREKVIRRKYEKRKGAK